MSTTLATRSGRYKRFLVAGTMLAASGFFLLCHLDADGDFALLSTAMVALGIGLGLMLQVLALVAQNAVDHRDLGVAMSTATFFWAIGGSVGATLFGVVLAIHLEHWLGRLGESGASTRSSGVDGNAVVAWANALQDVFLTAIPFAVLACIVAALARELPLDDGSLGRSRLA